jgi:formylglycine-generating enzyme required for sulfatase activity
MPEGIDHYGRYREIGIGRQTLRLRWIPPGEFYMGSPEDEPERGEKERRHRVILTRGFWLAETVCPQSLWREVMDKNPSRFQGNDLPVENVSWYDVQEFLTRLNKFQPGLQARLPSEAEWEYACRAGTQTPFWWGDELTPDLANYNGEYPYHNGPKREYREKTLPVGSFEANPWGLYQMHGNIWEWCEDWYEEYSEDEVQIDPVGPNRGSGRVVRGGGWADGGRWLRAAYRYRWRPAGRYGGLGFRLAAGPRPGGAEQMEADGEPAAKASGSERRSRFFDRFRRKK